MKNCVVSSLILNSMMSGSVSISCENMFGGVMIVVIMNVLMIMYGCIFFSFFRDSMFIWMSSMMMIGILNVILNVMNILSMKFRQLLMLVVILVLSGVLQCVIMWKIVGNMRKYVNVILYRNRKQLLLMSGVMSFFLCWYSFGVMNVQIWYSMIGSVIMSVMSIVIFIGMKNELVMLVMIILLFFGRLFISGCVSSLKMFGVQQMSLRNMMIMVNFV